jgi:type IV secretory pathway VirB4 component
MYNNRNEVITGIKIQPRNIFILDQASMDSALIGLMNFYNTIDFEFWLIVADRPVDIAVYQAELQVLYNQTLDPRIRKLIAQDMSKGDFFVNNDVVDTEYFILFKEKDGQMLQKKLRNMINSLATAGLVASQTSNDDLRMIIDNFFNGGRKYESGGVMPV